MGIAKRRRHEYRPRPLAPAYDGLNIPTFTLTSTVLTDGADASGDSRCGILFLGSRMAWLPGGVASFMLMLRPETPIPRDEVALGNTRHPT